MMRDGGPARGVREHLHGQFKLDEIMVIITIIPIHSVLPDVVRVIVDVIHVLLVVVTIGQRSEEVVGRLWLTGDDEGWGTREGGSGAPAWTI